MTTASTKADLNITIAEERVTEHLLDDLRVLFAEHWRELALYQDEILLEPEYESYKKMDEAGLLAPFIVRHSTENWILGYAVYFVRRHIHYRNHIWAVSDLFWIHPDHRNAGIGNALFAFAEQSLRERGCAVIHTTIKKEHPAAGFLLQSRGHAKIEEGYSLRLS